MNARGVFVTGTDTAVGKTLVSCALIHALRARGVRAHPFKPIAAGASLTAGSWRNEDTLALAAAAGLDDASLDWVTPVLLREAIAPHIAASHEGRSLEKAALLEAFSRVARAAPFVVVEGVGGFRVPLGEDWDSADLCAALGLPVVLVVGMRLGCLNHALLTVEAVHRTGVRLAGWVANRIDPDMPAHDENVETLARRIRAPLLGRIPHEPTPVARDLAVRIDVAPLLAPA